MDDFTREKRKEYYRKWRKQNKDKVKQYNENYWARKAREQGGDTNEKNHKK